jgi:hypothetical protein
MIGNRFRSFRPFKIRDRRRKIGMWMLLTLLAAYGAYCLWIPPSVSGQPTQPTREYIYLDGKAVAVEE